MPRRTIALAATLLLICTFALASPAAAETGTAAQGQAVAEVPARPLDPDGPDFVPGALVEVESRGRVDPYLIQREAAGLFGRLGTPIIENEVDEYLVRFLTTGLDGEASVITAQVFVPALDAPHERPLYVFGSGTTGIAQLCAPSREQEYAAPLGNARGYLLAYAGRGFTAIIPDYLGYDQPGRWQSYFNAEAEGRVMLDAVRAVDEFFERRQGQPAPASRSVFLGGYSQGGHAAFAAADLLPLYAPEVELTGVMGFGATTDVERLLVEGPYYAPYILLSYLQDYGEDLVDPREILASRWQGSLEAVAGEQCVDRVQDYYPFDSAQVYAPEFASALSRGELEQSFPGLASILESNRTGRSAHGLPSLLVQGANDVIVWNDTQAAFARELCELGSEVTYLLYAGVRHRETRPAGFEASIAWMKALDAEGVIDSSCVRLTDGQAILPTAP